MKLQIEKAVYGGFGLARLAEEDGAGREIRVPFTLPGEVIDATLKDGRAELGEAVLNQVLEPSPARVEPRCQHFGTCGGCQYQHAGYPEQIAMKVAILQETLARAELGALPGIEAHFAEPWGYRNRTRLRIAENEGLLRVGYNRRGTTEFLPIRECPISASLLWRAAEAVERLGLKDSWARGVVEVEFLTDAEETKLQMTLFVRKESGGFAAFCERMQVLVPELVGAGVSLLSAHGGRRAQRPRPISSWGAEGLGYRVAEEEYWVSRGAFFQVNRFLIDELVEVVTKGRKGLLAWDLYAGVGLFSRALAHSFQQVVAVEGADLLRSFKGEGRRAVEAAAVDFLRGAVVQRETPELVVVDPPRAGLGAEVSGLLARVSAAEMVYVSCDPVTLARDLKVLVGGGYRVAEVHMFDLFPQTFHLETVAVLRK